MMPDANALVALPKSDASGVARAMSFTRTIFASLAAMLVLGASLVACGTDPQPNTTASPAIPVDTPVPSPAASPVPSAPPTAAPVGTSASPPTGPATGPTQPPAAPLVPAADSFPTPPDRDLFRLARELLPGVGEVARAGGVDAPTLAVGHRQSFELVNLAELERYVSDFELRLVTPNAYWFVEDGARVNQADLEKSAEVFQTTTYPRITEAFGTEWKPGIDGDPHLYILNASLSLVGGYYSPADEYPKAVSPVSNEIEAVYINVRFLELGTGLYDQVLAHELQHAVHWNADPTEATWFNEGLSELAVTLAGFEEGSVGIFRRLGPISLTVWPANDVGGAAYYGAASLFMHYFTEHYGDRSDLRPLLSEQADGILGIDSYLRSGGYDQRFEDVFRDWGVANLLDEPSGRYSYRHLDISFPVSRTLRMHDELASVIPQYSTEYLKLNINGPSVLTFAGDAAAELLPVEAADGCWWSNSGDVIDSTMTAVVDLRALESPNLEYEVWYAIEEDWDYAYVEVSTYEGETWQILETPYSSTRNPIASAFGPGYTGSSNGWLRESVPLHQWAGQEIMLRFQYVTDAAIHDHGLCVRNLLLSGPSGRAVNLQWQPDGFVWTNNQVRQHYNVQVIYEGKEHSDSRVLQIDLNEVNHGTLRLEPDADARRVVVAVQAMAPSTRLPAKYTIRMDPAE